MSPPGFPFSIASLSAAVVAAAGADNTDTEIATVTVIAAVGTVAVVVSDVCSDIAAGAADMDRSRIGRSRTYPGR